VIRALIKGQVVGNNVLANIFARTLTLLKEFDLYRLTHIKRELNPLVDHWAKAGSGLNEGVIIVNGVQMTHSIP
jgi:hypothetical protein